MLGLGWHWQGNQDIAICQYITHSYFIFIPLHQPNNCSYIIVKPGNLSLIPSLASSRHPQDMLSGNSSMAGYLDSFSLRKYMKENLTKASRRLWFQLHCSLSMVLFCNPRRVANNKRAPSSSLFFHQHNLIIT